MDWARGEGKLDKTKLKLKLKLIQNTGKPTVPESRRASIDIFLKAAGYLDCAVRHVLPHLPPALRGDLPVDLAEGVLRALCLQALGQGVEIQLGLAIDSTKATLAVKRRLACEMVKCWQQAQDNITNLPLANCWGEKHQLFVKWKYIEAKNCIVELETVDDNIRPIELRSSPWCDHIKNMKIAYAYIMLFCKHIFPCAWLHLVLRETRDTHLST
ncbi:unnamed protein product [Ilex paraguariensis]|uniref:Uncharacterized protein n=1 Tax=Ilex paraguariensis TaxID=185542 RepID=A0ABC8THQ0_9AQUA